MPRNDHALGSVFSRTQGRCLRFCFFICLRIRYRSRLACHKHGIRAKQRNGAHLPRRSDSYGLRIARFFDSKSEYRLHVPHSRRLDCNGVVHAIYGIARSFGIGQYYDGYFDFVLRIALAHARERSPRKEAPRIFPARPCPGSRTFVGYGGSGMRRLGHRRQSHRSERSKCRKPLGACNCGFSHILRLFALFLKTLTGRLRRNRPR